MKHRKKTILLTISFSLIFLFSFSTLHARNAEKGFKLHVNEGELILEPLNDNAIRVRYQKAGDAFYPEDIIYTESVSTPKYKVKEDAKTVKIELKKITVFFNKENETLHFTDHKGNIILKEKVGGRTIESDILDDIPIYKVEQRFESPSDEYLFGTGQFQDGYLNIRGLPRRLTQVNSQISIPFILSSYGYGLLWNNYGITEFNPG